MTQFTIDYVNPEVREWTAKDGVTLYFVEAYCVPRATLSMMTTKDKVDEVKASLEALKDTPTEMEVERKDDFRGEPQYKLKNYPGKPAGASGGGGGGRGGGGMSHTQAGVLAAATLLAPGWEQMGANLGTEQIWQAFFDTAERITQHLFDRKGPGQETQAESTNGQTAPPSVTRDSVTLAQLQVLRDLGWQLKLNPDQAAYKAGKPLEELTSEEADVLIQVWNADLKQNV